MKLIPSSGNQPYQVLVCSLGISANVINFSTFCPNNHILYFNIFQAFLKQYPY